MSAETWREPTPAECLAAAAPHWPELDALCAPVRLAGENLNLRVALADGAPAVLKIATDPDADVALEEAMLARLASAGLPVPASRPDASGERVVALHGRSARLQAFLPGTPWRDVPASAALGRRIGALLARAHAALVGFEHAGADRTHAWDLARPGQHAPKLSAVGDAARRDALARVLAEHAELVAPALASCPRGVLHGDANDENVLVDGDEPTGLIDLGDALRGALVVDLALTLAYAAQHGALAAGAANLPLAAAVVAGYHAARPLTDAERPLLFPLLRARLAVSALIGAQRRADAPAHATWYSHEETTWRTFDSVAAMTLEEGAGAVLAEVGK